PDDVARGIVVADPDFTLATALTGGDTATDELRVAPDELRVMSASVAARRANVALHEDAVRPAFAFVGPELDDRPRIAGLSAERRQVLAEGAVRVHELTARRQMVRVVLSNLGELGGPREVRQRGRRGHGGAH